VFTPGEERRVTDRATTCIESIGVYLPPNETTSESRVAGIKNRIRVPLERFTGIKSTRCVSPGEYSFDLACRAIERSLERSRYRAEEIGLLIACNISKYDHEGFVFPIEPNTATRLRKTLGLQNALAFDIGNACAGMLTGVLVADSFLHTADIEAAIVVSGEYISHLADSAQLEIASVFDSRLACLTLGDSGAAVVLVRSRDNAIGFQHIDLLTLGGYSSLCRSAPASTAGKGAIMFTKSTELLKAGVIETARHFVSSMHRHGWDPETVDHVIPHQVTKGAPDIFVREINSRLNGVKLPKGKMIDNIAKRGNTATTSHFVALHDQLETKHIGCGDRVVFSVTASGLTVGTALYVLDDLPSRMRNGAASKEDVLTTKVPGPSSAPAAQEISVASVASTRLRQKTPESTEEIALEAAELCLSRAVCRREDIGVLMFAGVFKGGFLAEPSYATILAGKLFPHASPGPEGHAVLAFDLHHGPNGFLAACEIFRTIAVRRGLTAGLFITAEFEDNRLLAGYPQVGVAEVASAAVILPPGGPGTRIGKCQFFSFDEHENSFRANAIGVNPVHVSFRVDRDYERHLRCSIRKAIGAYLLRNDWTLSNFDEFYFPQISSEFLCDVADDLGLARDRVIDVCIPGKDLFTSSLPCALEEAQRSGSAGRGKNCLAVSAGPGINVCCAVLRGIGS
jgi:3-oxoacyl-[acyl-carrier-protein] synthase III